MPTARGTYIPRDVHQPRGKQPWCAACDTADFLSVDSPAVADRRTGLLVIALRCSKCRLSRVFDTTAAFISSLALRRSPTGNRTGANRVTATDAD
jgi:hypothetical protein